MKKFILGFLIVLLLLIPQLFPFLPSGFFTMHDDTQVARVVVMGKALRNGQFPVRWVDDLGYGYGYPIFNFYGPLPYYTGGVFYALGFSALLSTKIMFVVGILFAAISMYICSFYLFGVLGGILGSVTYSYSTYHAVQVFVRGSVGEYWVTVFVPLLFLASVMIFRKKTETGILLGSISLACIVLSHTLLGYVTTLFFLASIGVFLFIRYFITKDKNVSSIISILKVFFFGLGLSIFFWLPAFSEMKYTNVANQVSETAWYKDHFVCLSQFWYSPWGFGGSTKGCLDGLSFSLGKIIVLLTFLSLLNLLINNKRTQKVLITGILVTFFSIFFSTEFSKHLWDILPFFEYIQYPWRFLTFFMFGSALLISSLSILFRKWLIQVGVIFVCIVLLVWFQVDIFLPQYIYQIQSDELESELSIKWKASKISDEYLPADFNVPKSPNEVAHDTITSTFGVETKTVILKETFKKFEIVSKKKNELEINQIAFPGWKYIVNGKEATYKIVNMKPIIDVPEGFSTLELHFYGTRMQLLGNLVSLATVLYLIIHYGKKTIT